MTNYDGSVLTGTLKNKYSLDSNTLMIKVTPEMITDSASENSPYDAYPVRCPDDAIWSILICGHGCDLDAGAQRRLTAAMNGKRSVMTRDPTDGEGQLHTLGLLEQLRCECKGLWGSSSDAYFRVDRLLRQLADPSLHDIPSTYPSASRCGTETNSTFAGHRRIGEHRGRACCARCRDCELSGSAVHLAQRGAGHTAALARKGSTE